VQLVQNAAARVVTGTGSKITARRCLMTYTAWLLVRQRIIFKLAMTVFKCINGLATSYLADHCVLTLPVACRRHLRSANTRTLLLRRTKTAIGTEEFAVSLMLYGTSNPWNFECCPVQCILLQRLKNHRFIDCLKRI